MTAASNRDLDLAVWEGKFREDLTLAAVERRHIPSVLERTGWRVSGRHGAAEILGLKATCSNRGWRSSASSASFEFPKFRKSPAYRD